LVSPMPKSTPAFTLVEVLVSVVIISVVIGALLQIFSNNAFTFRSVNTKITETNRVTLLIGNTLYGLEDDKVPLDELLKEFNLEDELRRRLKKVKVEILYTELQSIDFDDAAEAIAQDSDEDQGLIQDAAEASSALEIGRTTMIIDHQSSSYVRIKFQ